LIAISLPLRKVNSRSESESARALLEDIKTFCVKRWGERCRSPRQLLITGYRLVGGRL
jgi:hypothetical protein